MTRAHLASAVLRAGWLFSSVLVVGTMALAMAKLEGGREARADASGPTSPVLVELFTSEGCSSCPAAETELSRLAATQPVAGVRIIPLAFHVDYWDRLGWADPFSSPAWTARQGDYAGPRGGNVYTPEAIVNGGRDCVGSDDPALLDLVRNAARLPRVSVAVTRAVAASPDTLRVSVEVGARGRLGSRDVTLDVAITESGLRVAVPRGENGGRVLDHAPVVRDLRRAGSVLPSGGTFDVVLAVPGASRRENLEIVAFVQDGSGGPVLGVGTMRPFTASGAPASSR
jgi:hypothetical protein